MVVPGDAGGKQPVPHNQGDIHSGRRPAFSYLGKSGLQVGSGYNETIVESGLATANDGSAKHPTRKGTRWGIAGLILGLIVFLATTVWYCWLMFMATSCTVDTGDLNEDSLFRASLQENLSGKGDRPAFLVLFHDAKSRELGCFPESIWESIMPGEGPGSTISLGDLSVSVERGNTDDVIERNLTQFISKAGPGRWQKLAAGYIIHLGAGSKTHDLAKFRNRRLSMPPVLLLSPDLDKSCRLLEELTGLAITVAAKQPVRTVVKKELFGKRGHQSQQLHFRTKSRATADGLVAEVAAFHGCVAKRQGKMVVVVGDPTEPELQARVAKLVAAYDFDPGLYTLPPAAGPLVINYLQSPDENAIQFALYTLIRMKQPVGRSAVLRMLKSRPALSEATRLLAAQYLAVLGDEAALPYLVDHAGYWREEAVLAAGWVRTAEGAEVQARIIGGGSPRFSKFRVGRVDIDKLPDGVSAGTARRLLRLSLDCAGKFFSPVSTKETHAHLRFSPDGKSARCMIRSGHYEGPLSAWFDIYEVEWVEVAGNWFVISYQDAGIILS
jgi:hypothetical protein